MPAQSTLKPYMADERFPDIDFLSEVINTAPSPAVTQLLIRIARKDPDSRAIPSAPLQPRQKRLREPDPATVLATRVKVEGDQD